MSVHILKSRYNKNGYSHNKNKIINRTILLTELFKPSYIHKINIRYKIDRILNTCVDKIKYHHVICILNNIRATSLIYVKELIIIIKKFNNINQFTEKIVLKLIKIMKKNKFYCENYLNHISWIKNNTENKNTENKNTEEYKLFLKSILYFQVSIDEYFIKNNLDYFGVLSNGEIINLNISKNKTENEQIILSIIGLHQVITEKKLWFSNLVGLKYSLYHKKIACIKVMFPNYVYESAYNYIIYIQKLGWKNFVELFPN